MSSRNAPPHRRGGALRDDTKNACGAEYYIEVISKTRAGGTLSKGWQHTVTIGLSLIIRVNIVLNRTVVVDSD